MKTALAKSSVTTMALLLYLESAVAQGSYLDPKDHTELHSPYADQLGELVAALDDLDGDAIRDLAVGSAPGGYLRVLSGRDASLLQTISVPSGFTSLLPAGDLTGDGLGEIIVGAPGGAGRLVVVSPVDGQTVKTIAATGNESGFGRSLLELADLTGDGVAEIVAGAPNSMSSAGRVVVLDLMTEVRIHAVLGPEDGSLFGWALDRAADLDGLGSPDVLVGAPGEYGGLANAGAVYAISMDSFDYWSPVGGALPLAFGSASSQLGQQLAALSDLDADGFPDFASFNWTSSQATCFSMATGNAVATHPCEALAPIGDLDSDGTLDLCLAYPTKITNVPHGLGSASGAVQVWSPAKAGDIAVGSAFFAGEGFGSSVRNLGDLNGDGRSEFCVSSLRWSPNPQTLFGDRSAVAIYSYDEFPTPPRISDTALLAPGDTHVARFFFPQGKFPDGTPVQFIYGSALDPTGAGWIQSPKTFNPNATYARKQAKLFGAAVPPLTFLGVQSTVQDGWAWAVVAASSDLTSPAFFFLEAQARDNAGNWIPSGSGLVEVIAGEGIVPATTLLNADLEENVGDKLRLYDLSTKQSLTVGDLESMGGSVQISVHLGAGASPSVQLSVASNGTIDWSPLAPIVKNCALVVPNVAATIVAPGVGTAALLTFNLGRCLNTFITVEWAWRSVADFSNWGPGSTFGGWQYANAIVGKTFDQEAYGLLINAGQVHTFKTGTATATTADVSFASSSCPSFWPGDHALFSDLSSWGVGNLDIFGSVGIGFCAGSCNGNGTTCGSIATKSSGASWIIRKKKWSELN